MASTGEYVAILDDDDQWLDKNKLSKQSKYLDINTEVVLCGGGIKIINEESGIVNEKFRLTDDFGFGKVCCGKIIFLHLPSCSGASRL